MSDSETISVESEQTVADKSAHVQQRQGWPFYVAAVVLIALAWLVAEYHPFTKISVPEVLDEFSIGSFLLGTSALSWLLQWGAVISVLVGYFGYKNKRTAIQYAASMSLTFAGLWWAGVAYKYWGLNLLDFAAEEMFRHMSENLGGHNEFDYLLFKFVGPVLGPLQLNGPMLLGGWDFWGVFCSTALLVGYLFFVGCFLGEEMTWRDLTIRYVAKYIMVFLPVFIPPTILLIQKALQVYVVSS